MFTVSRCYQVDKPRTKRGFPARRPDLSEPQLSPTPTRSAWGIAEAVVVVGLLELIIWSLHELENQRWAIGAIVIMVLVGSHSVWRTRHSTVARVIKVSARVAWKRVGYVTGSAVVLLLALGLASGTFNGSTVWEEITRRPPTHWLLVKAPTVFAQQAGLQWFLLPLSLEVFRRKQHATCVCGCVFAMLHLPNPLLVVITFMAGITWCWLYLHSGRIMPILVSHLLLAVLASVVADHALYRLRVGPPCLRLLPRTVRADDGSTIRTQPEAIHGFVCSFRPRGSQVICTGWMLNQETKQMPDKLVVLAQGRFHTLHIKERRLCPDVVEFYNDPTLAPCGFRLKLPRSWFGEDRLRFFGETASREFTELKISARRYVR